MPNFTFLAQNSEYNYIRQAELLALSIRKTNPDSKICLITNDNVERTELFDDIVPIPWEDKAEEHKWKVQNRWKIYHACPYDSTFVLDTDMLVCHNLSNWWNLMQNYEVFYTTNVTDYKQCKLNATYYRKMFNQTFCSYTLYTRNIIRFITNKRSVQQVIFRTKSKFFSH